MFSTSVFFIACLTFWDGGTQCTQNDARDLPTCYAVKEKIDETYKEKITNDPVIVGYRSYCLVIQKEEIPA